MRSLLFTAILFAFFGVPAAAMQIDRAGRQQFEEKYGPQFRKVMASRPTEDDVAMAGELLAVARLTRDNNPLVVEMCENAFVLGMRDAAGHDSAIDAMELLAVVMPDKAAAARDKVVAFLRRILATAKGEERSPIAQRLITLFARQADALAAASDFGGAAKLYGQAIKLAEDEKITDIAPLKAKFDVTSSREKLELRLEAANVKLASDPTSAAVNAELLQIYLVDLDNPTQASRYLAHGGNETAKKLLPLAAAGITETLTAAQCMEIGEWYELLSLEAPTAARPALNKRSRAFYEQFLLLPEADRLQQVKAALAIKRLRDATAKLNPDEAKTLATVNDEGWADQLLGIEPVRYRVSGRWRRSDTGLHVNAASDPARLMLPGGVRDSYEMTAKFTRTLGDGPVVFILPVGERAVRLVLSGWAGKASGLYSIGEEKVEAETGVRRNTSTVVPGTLVNEQEHTLAVRTVLKGNDVTFAIDLNGERYIDWTGPQSELRVEPEWSLRETYAFGVGAMNASVQFGAVKVRALRGDVALLPKPLTLAERGVVTPSDGFVDLMEIWDGSKDVYEGAWVRELDSLLVDRLKKATQARTRLPVLPDGNYTVRTRFTCVESRKGLGGPVLSLPVKETRAVIAMGLGHRGNLAGLALIGGKDAINNDTTTPGDVFEVGKQHTLEARVAFIEETVRIEADFDGKKLIRWEGPRSSITPPADWAFGDGKSPGIGMHIAEFSFESIEMRMDSGTAPLVRQPAKKLVVDTTPVDVIKLIDPRKHAYAGAWTTDAGKLTTNTATTSTIMLPVVPSGNYEFRAKFARSGGRPVIDIHLPVPGSSIDLTIGANDGKTCSLSTPPAVKGDPATNITSNSSVRLVNSTYYTLKVKVETTGPTTHVAVELDGKPYLDWKGSAAELRPQVTLPPGFNSRAVGIFVSNPVARSGATFSDIEVRMLTGAMRKLE